MTATTLAGAPIMSARTPAISPTDILSLGDCPVGWASPPEPCEPHILVPNDVNNSGNCLDGTDHIIELSCTPSNFELRHYIPPNETLPVLLVVGKHWIDVTGAALCTSTASAFMYFSRRYPRVTLVGPTLGTLSIILWRHKTTKSRGVVVMKVRELGVQQGLAQTLRTDTITDTASKSDPNRMHIEFNHSSIA
jgi:hypothetical protein